MSDEKTPLADSASQVHYGIQEISSGQGGLPVPDVVERINVGIQAAVTARLGEIEQLHGHLLTSSTLALANIKNACGREGETLTPLEVSELVVERLAILESDLAAKDDLLRAAQAGQETLQEAFMRDLAASLEREAALAAALERLRANALEMAGYVKSYGLDDHGPQSEWSRWSQCRSNIENICDHSAILAAHDAEVVEAAQKRMKITLADGTVIRLAEGSSVLNALAEVARKAKIEALTRFNAVWMEEPPVSDGGRWASELLVDEIAALKAEGGKG